ncbi:DUF3137 domain-containing protein [Shinella sp. CPCC 101442]|uniref:DUF3137 domain-containing protein n=1 Tax=Shinella sp. CPCC 101442 TaxID=2932265 RepID=UPI002152116B|nr:DUF3137 domain-containing protein [Shinella sp. CPCC 101442]MCR6499724.1 DUF3137 domain-containing protein [Shinella sp. CPCC 101442]
MDTMIDEAALMPKEDALEELRVAVAAYNAERGTVTNTLYVNMVLMFGGYVVFACILAYIAVIEIDTDIVGIVLGVLFFGGTVVWRYALAPSKRFQQDLRDRMLPLVFGFIDEVQYVHGAEPRFMSAMPGKELVPRDRSEHGDTISGRHDGLAFTLSETELVSGSGKSRSTTFKGVIFHFIREQAFPGLLVAARKPNAVQLFMRDFFGGSKLALVPSSNPEVDASHEFRTDRPEAATPIVQGALAKALDYLATEWRDDVVRLALNGRDCYLLVPSKRNFFELPPVDTPIDFDRHLRPMIRDLVTLLATAQLVNKIG